MGAAPVPRSSRGWRRPIMSCIILKVGAAEKPNVQEVKAGPCSFMSALESARRGAVVTVSECLASRSGPPIPASGQKSWVIGTKEGQDFRWPLSGWDLQVQSPRLRVPRLPVRAPFNASSGCPSPTVIQAPMEVLDPFELGPSSSSNPAKRSRAPVNRGPSLN